jgi:drug/metabolite transporter (DMT)-like permease
MFLGLLFAIGACFIWGFIFIVPSYLSDFSSVEVVLGRYGTYGILSLILFFRSGTKQIKRYTFKTWGFAFIFALFSNLVYYLGLVAGLRFASPTLTVLIVGMAPILIALYGNWQTREIAYRDLVIPCLWIAFGLILVNITEIDWSFKATTPLQYLWGIIGILIALFSWSGCAVYNARFLKRHLHLSISDWTNVIGVATFFWSLVVGILFALFAHEEMNFTRLLTISPLTLRYLGGALILGVLCSWLGCYLWNQASLHLPVSLMGSLLMFETLFGLLFVFFFHNRIPTWIEIAGITSMIAGIFMCIQAFRKKQIQTPV